MSGEAVKMSMDKGKAIESALSQIEKKFGKGSIMKMGERPVEDIRAISTNCLSLDAAIGIGGVPRIEWTLPGDSSGQPGDPGEGGSGEPGDAQPSTRCYVGTELLRTCVPFDTLLRIFWKRESVN